MKIGFVGTFPSQDFAPMSGPRRVCVNLSHGLRRVVSDGLEVIAFGESAAGWWGKVFGRPRREERSGRAVIRVGYLLLPWFIGRYDVVYFAGGPFHALLPVILSRFCRYPPLAYCAHGIIRNERKLHTGEESRASYWREVVEGVILKLCQTVVCASPVSADMVVTEWNIPRSKIVLVPHGVGDEFAAVRGARESQPGPLKLVTISQVHRYKGLEFLVEALGRLKDLDFALDVISTGGSRAYRAELEALAYSYGPDFRARIRFVGPCNRAELTEHFASASVYVQSSRQETFCLAVLEAMSAGLPVVLTQTTGVSYLLKDGENGFIVPYGETESLTSQLRRLLTDSELRRRMGEANRVRARELNWENSARLLMNQLCFVGGHLPNSVREASARPV
jgi:glycosyltransferase involved in cell wall biosynthesis